MFHIIVIIKNYFIFIDLIILLFIYIMNEIKLKPLTIFFLILSLNTLYNLMTIKPQIIYKCLK